MFWVAVASAAAVLLFWYLPLRARVDAAMAGRVWEVRLTWLAPGGRFALWRLRWHGHAAPGRMLHDLRALTRRSTWALVRDLVDWVPLFVLLQFARLETVTLRLRFGTGDPALTGMAAGGLWGAAAGAAAWFARRFGPLRRPPRLEIEPVFDRACWQVRAGCIAASTPRDIIVALLWKLAVGIRHAWRRGVKSTPWKGIPSKV
ncbi:MAG TPA: DUF2953 domain-containing protein [Bacillota bacterium]